MATLNNRTDFIAEGEYALARILLFAARPNRIISDLINYFGTQRKSEYENCAENHHPYI